MSPYDEPALPMLDQAALAWGAITPLERRGVAIERIEIGHRSKPVIHVMPGLATYALKGAESHVTRSDGDGDIVVMVTDYRGCQVQWREPRGGGRG